MRVVIAEKDQIGRRLLAQLLRMEGHDVLLIEEGGDVGDFMKRHRPDVVLMNMFSAQEGEGCGAIKPDSGAADCLSPVVVMTSIGACEHLSAFMEMEKRTGTDGFDRLPTNAKIGAMEHVQRICEMLSRNLCYSGRNEMKRPAIRSSGQGSLDLYAR
jgi:DNA-binding NtrC family response regulator